MSKRNQLGRLERMLGLGYETNVDANRITIPVDLRKDLSDNSTVYYVNRGLDLFLVYSQAEYKKLNASSDFPQPGSLNFESELADKIYNDAFTVKPVVVQKQGRLTMPIRTDKGTTVSLVKFPGAPYILLYLGTLNEMANYLEQQRTQN